MLSNARSKDFEMCKGLGTIVVGVGSSDWFSRSTLLMCAPSMLMIDRIGCPMSCFRVAQKVR